MATQISINYSTSPRGYQLEMPDKLFVKENPKTVLNQLIQNHPISKFKVCTPEVGLCGVVDVEPSKLLFYGEKMSRDFIALNFSKNKAKVKYSFEISEDIPSQKYFTSMKNIDLDFLKCEVPYLQAPQKFIEDIVNNNLVIVQSEGPFSGESGSRETVIAATSYLDARLTRKEPLMEAKLSAVKEFVSAILGTKVNDNLLREYITLPEKGAHLGYGYPRIFPPVQPREGEVYSGQNYSK